MRDVFMFLTHKDVNEVINDLTRALDASNPRILLNKRGRGSNGYGTCWLQFTL